MPKNSQSAFTILELMVVLVIIGILMSVFVIGGGRMFSSSNKRKAQAQLTALSAAIEEFRQIENQYPDDRLPAGITGNVQNSCAEALFLALYDSEYSGRRPDQEWLINLDGDTLRKAMTSLPSRELFEFGDPWMNPIVYFESLHYGDQVVVLAGAEGAIEEQTVTALRNERTGAWEASGGFQLISAGEDGFFGTEDDISQLGS
ncbi:MAG: type II secretion system protein [Planctomycetota bacterium]|jgi:prepilin-type N-terminal cleavage/methylation domain-containing protein|nr:type II secretion system protein [Planctomycetota bacterium]